MADGPRPGDWSEVLQRFADTLAGVEQQLAQATATEPAAADAGRAAVHDAGLTQAAAQHAGLEIRLGEITRWVDAIEAELRVSEDLMRVLLTQTETVRQKLATWAGRAIG